MGGVALKICISKNLYSFIQLLDVQLKDHCESLTKTLLDLLSCAEAFELAFDLNCHFCAKCFSFFHRMCSDDESRLLSLFSNGFPKSSSWEWIYAGRCFVKHDNLRWREHSQGSHQLSLITSTEFVCVCIEELIELELLCYQLGVFLSKLLFITFELSEEYEFLFNCQFFINWTFLRTVANNICHLLRRATIPCNVITTNLNSSLRGYNISCQALEGCSLTSSINTQKNKAFSFF